MGSDGGMLGPRYHPKSSGRPGFRQQPKTRKKQRRKSRK